MADYQRMFSELSDPFKAAVNNTARQFPQLAIPGILAKPIVEAAGKSAYNLASRTKEAMTKGKAPLSEESGPILADVLNTALMGGPAGALSSQGSKGVAPAFYSALNKAVETSPINTGHPQQWAGWLKNQPGIKQEEMDWLGVPEFLQGQKGPVSKQQLQEHIKANQVDVQEVTKSQGSPRLTPSEYEAKAREQGVNWDDPVLRRDFVERVDRFRDADTTKFSQYQLPGGENYRELLLTMPPKSGLRMEPSQTVNRWNLVDASGETVKRDLHIVEARQLAGEGFTSSHYDEPNILAHVRFNDRVDAQGKKTLFLEEIQSDWHQKGRKEGYQGASVDETPRYTVRSRDEAVFGDANGKQWVAEDANGSNRLFRTEREAREWADQQNKYEIENVRKKNLVPDAPFKSSWPELSLKRMIKWAADNGYDQIAWTPGKVQAERYDLSKHLENLTLYKTHDGKLLVRGTDKNGNQAIELAPTVERPIEDIIGKEAAEKLENMEWKDTAAGRGWQAKTLSNLDLQVGGEGMKGFYDKMLVSAANKLGKKYGAKVGVTKIPEPYTGELKGLPGETAIDAMRRQQRFTAQREVWSLPITDALKQKATGEGFSLFTGGKGGSLAALLSMALDGRRQDR
jgi:hypothetical protein